LASVCISVHLPPKKQHQQNYQKTPNLPQVGRSFENNASQGVPLRAGCGNGESLLPNKKGDFACKYYIRNCSAVQVVLAFHKDSLGGKTRPDWFFIKTVIWQCICHLAAIFLVKVG